MIQGFNFNNVRDQLKVAGIIANEEELSVLFGKGPSYVSSRKSKNEPPSFDALTHLAFNLQHELSVLESDIRQGHDVTESTFAAAKVLYELQKQLFADLRQAVMEVRNGS